MTKCNIVRFQQLNFVLRLQCERSKQFNTIKIVLNSLHKHKNQPQKDDRRTSKIQYIKITWTSN